MYSISVQNASKRYKLYNKPSDRLREAVFPFLKTRCREFYALNDISFDVNKGETVGIIGKNGSGKSTLLKILTGVLTQTEGIVTVDGRVSALLELGAGFNPEYTGIENIYLNGSIMGFTKEQMTNKLDEILAFADIGDFVYQSVKTYSSGMFVRLAFAVAISVEPDVLIVDEALAVGDYRFQAKCYKKFDELKTKGTTILFVTHDVDAVRRFCSRALWINEGKMVMDGGVSEVTSKYMEFITGNGSLPVNRNDSPIYEVSDVITTHIYRYTPQEFNAINRFGSHTGAVESVELYKNEKLTHVFDVGDKITVKIRFNVPEGADTDKISVALAVKNKAGLDLFVISTADKNINITNGTREAYISFDNYLAAGEYSVAAALENRATLPITYFDYIEGAEYFKVMTDKEYYGVVVLPSEVRLAEGDKT